MGKATVQLKIATVSPISDGLIVHHSHFHLPSFYPYFLQACITGLLSYSISLVLTSSSMATFEYLIDQVALSIYFIDF